MQAVAGSFFFFPFFGGGGGGGHLRSHLGQPAAEIKGTDCKL